jgi:hypothetical protein
LLQEPDEGSPGTTDVQLPAYDPEPGGGAGAGVEGTLGTLAAPGAVGSRISELLSKRAHAVENVEAAASVARKTRVLFMVIC